MMLKTMAGVVSAINAKGIKLEGRGDAWLNFSKPEYRGHFEMPQKGDNVKLGVTPYKDTYFIQTCEIQHSGQYEVGQVPTSGRELSITRSVAMKAATEVVVALINRRAYVDLHAPGFGLPEATSMSRRSSMLRWSAMVRKVARARMFFLPFFQWLQSAGS